MSEALDGDLRGIAVLYQDLERTHSIVESNKKDDRRWRAIQKHERSTLPHTGQSQTTHQPESRHERDEESLEPSKPHSSWGLHWDWARKTREDCASAMPLE